MRRVGFGRDNISKLVQDIGLYTTKFGASPICDAALQALGEYVRFNQAEGHHDPALEERIRALPSPSESHLETLNQGGVVVQERAAYLVRACVDLRDFFSCRSSVRDYASVPVAETLVRQAVSMAMKTPSVCNRQAWRVWTVEEPAAIVQALTIQGGVRTSRAAAPADGAADTATAQIASMERIRRVRVFISDIPVRRRSRRLRSNLALLATARVTPCRN